MSKGNRVVLTPDRGFRVEGIVNAGETHYPGMVVQIDPTQATQGGRFVFKIYTTGTDGKMTKGPAIIIMEDINVGKTTADSFAAGEHVTGWVPLAGCELNLLYKNVSGTADDVLAGDTFIIDDTTGKMIVDTGSPEQKVAMTLEAVVDPTTDTLTWSIWR